MKKTLSLALAATMLAPTAFVAAAVPAQAQTREIARDRQDVREERRELRDAQRYGDRRDVREERREYRDARQELREDKRDWRAYKAANRNVFRGPRFSAPFRYRAFGANAVVPRSYWSSRYYVANPGRYRLPAAGANRVWVRHYNDVLLINTRTGRVVTAYRGFYW